MLSSTCRWCFLLLACASAARLRTASPESGAALTVRVYWMRHGLSCANIVREFAPLFTGIGLQHLYGDPSLTNCAITHAQQLGAHIDATIQSWHEEWKPTPIPVFSSVLVRSIETALHNFGSADVYPIPYIAELGGEADNMPFPWTSEDAQNGTNEEEVSTQLKKLPRLPNTDNDIQRIKFLPLVNPVEDPDRKGEHKADYEKFLEEFPKILASILPDNAIVNGTVIPAIVVSHSGYMEKHLRCRGKGNKPRNNEVWVKDYSVKMLKLTDDERKIPRSERQAPAMVPAEGECSTAPLPKKSYPKYEGTGFIIKRPCKADIIRCTAGWMPRGWGADDESCCPGVELTE